MKKSMFFAIIIFTAIVSGVVLYLSHPKFGRTATPERQARIERSPNSRGGMFHNQEHTPMTTSDKSRVRMMYDFLFEKREGTRPKAEIPIIKTDLRTLPATEDLMVWFGHSSYLIHSGGRRFLIDPVFESASPLSMFNKPFVGTDGYKPEDMPSIDYLIITHDHWDHLDYETVTKLKPKHVVCPLGVGEYFEHWGFNNIIELDWNQSATLENGLTIHCLPSRHFSGRRLKSNITLWASFMIESQKTIYVGGDGGYGKHFVEIARQFPNIDVAVLENGQYNADWCYIHLMPEDLVKAINDLKAKKVFTFHNSKYALSKHAWDEPLNAAYSLNAITPMIGEVVNLDDSTRVNRKWWLSAQLAQQIERWDEK